MEKFKLYYKEHKELFYLGFLVLGCILFIFANIGIYPLIDIDETRYVNMSKYMFLEKQYLTPILNFEPFLEKPPLYFWLNVLVFKILGYKSVFAGRFATGMVATFGIFYTYFFAKKISNSRLYGFLSANVLLCSAWFLVFSHIAILDLGFMVFSMSAIYSAILALFVEKEQNKKFCWYFGYLFMALSILAKGFIGIAIPCMVVFFTYLLFKKVNELFKPINLLGVFILLIVALPWHIMIWEVHKDAWVNMYILKHHFARLLTSEDLGRKQPFLFYVPIFLMGLIPWLFNFLAKIYKDTKKLINKIKNTKNSAWKNFFYPDTKDKKVMYFAYTYALCTFLFFSSASTKLPPYILTMFPALALIVGDFWYRAIKFNETEKSLKISNYINFILLLTISILGLLFSMIYKTILPESAKYYIENAFSFALPALIFIVIISIFAIILIKKRKVFKVFLMHIILMLSVIFVVCGFGLPYYTSFAQDELEDFANYVYSIENSSLITYGFSAKYSILNPHKKIKYIVGEEPQDYKNLENYITETPKTKHFIMTRIKINDFENKKEYKKIKEGKVYRLYTKTLE